jgi:hypothetical protein
MKTKEGLWKLSQNNPSSRTQSVHYGAGKIMDKTNNEEFFDDCPIYRLIKAAKEQGRDPTAEEMKEAFKKAKEEGAIVGGERLEEDK